MPPGSSPLASRHPVHLAGSRELNAPDQGWLRRPHRECERLRQSKPPSVSKEPRDSSLRRRNQYDARTSRRGFARRALPRPASRSVPRNSRNRPGTFDVRRLLTSAIVVNPGTPEKLRTSHEALLPRCYAQGRSPRVVGLPSIARPSIAKTPTLLVRT